MGQRSTTDFLSANLDVNLGFCHEAASKKLQSGSKTAGAHRRVAKISNQVTECATCGFGCLEKVREVRFEIKEPSGSQVLSQNLAHEVNLVQRWQQLVVNPRGYGQSLISPLVSHPARHTRQHRLFLLNPGLRLSQALPLNEHLAGKQEWNRERSQSPSSSRAIDGGQYDSQESEASITNDKRKGLRAAIDILDKASRRKPRKKARSHDKQTRVDCEIDNQRREGGRKDPGPNPIHSARLLEDP
jgi:ribosomal protein L37E